MTIGKPPEETEKSDGQSEEKEKRPSKGNQLKFKAFKGSRNSVGAHVSEVMENRNRTIKFEDLSKTPKVGLDGGVAGKRRNSLNFVVQSNLAEQRR